MSPPARTAPLALDACGVLNLAAIMPLAKASRAFGRPLLVTAEAAAEALYLHDEEDGWLVRTPVDLSGLIVVQLEPREIAGYVTLATVLDDGEASTLAAAQVRGWEVWSDDRKARRLATELDPPVRVVSTAAVLRSWAQRNDLADAVAGVSLRQVEVRAHFTPPVIDPDSSWWQRCVDAAG